MGACVSGREGIDDAHLCVHQRVGGIDDPQRHFATRHEHHGAAHIVGAHQAILDLVPDSERSERRARVAAHRHRIRIAGGESSATERGREREAGRDLEFDLAVGGRDQHQPVAGEIAARRLLDQTALLQVVHPLLVGGDEDVGFAAGFHLAREHRAGGERQFHGHAGGSGPVRRQLAQNVGQRRGGEHQQLGTLLLLRRARNGQQCGRDYGRDERDKSPGGAVHALPWIWL